MAKRFIGSADVEVSPAGALTVFGLIPTGEVDLEPFALADDAEHPIALPEGAVILLLKADGDFVEGQAVPDPVNNLVRIADSVHSIPVAGRSVWIVKRVGADAVRVTGKILLGA